MNKFKLMLALLAAPSMVLTSCGPGTQEVQGSVSKVTVNCDPTVVAGKTITAIADVTATDGASEEVTWDTSDPTIATVDSNGVITGVKAGKVTITVTSSFDTSKFADVKIVVVAGEWPDEVKELMQKYFATVLPYFEGNFKWTEEENNMLYARSNRASDMQKIVEAYDRLEIKKEFDDNVILYTLPYSLDDKKCIVINVCVEGKTAFFMAVVSYIRYTKWETEKIADLVHSLDEETTTVIPEVSSVHFLYFNENYYASDEIHGLAIVPETNASGGYDNPTEEYVGILRDLGWFIKEGGTQFSNTTHICVSPDKKIVLELLFGSPYFYIYIYANTLSFPFDEMKAVMTALGSTDDPVVPEGFEMDKFYTNDSEWDSKGLYFIYTRSRDLTGIKNSFEEAWVSAGWTLVTLSNFYYYDSAAVSPDGKVCIEYGFYNNRFFDMYYHAYTESLS